jgi:hypothetical protein
MIDYTRKQIIKVFNIELLGFRFQLDERQNGKMWMSKKGELKHLTKAQVNELENTIEDWFDEVE